ncbi:MAG: phage protein Gp27 family protein [Limisphaerales bacterium]
MNTSADIHNILADARARANTDIRRRTGKIARLPAELRAWINQALLDGSPYQDIRNELERKGHSDISDGSLTSWFQGGYQDWLRSTEHLEKCRAFSEHAHEMARELNNDVHKIADLNETLVAAHLTQCLYAFDPNRGAHAVDDFLRIARAVNQQARERSIRHRSLLEARKYQDQVKAQTGFVTPNNDIATAQVLPDSETSGPVTLANPETTLAILPDCLNLR